MTDVLRPHRLVQNRLTVMLICIISFIALIWTATAAFIIYMNQVHPNLVAPSCAEERKKP